MKVSTVDDPQFSTRVNIYEVHPSPRGEGFDLISDAISTGKLHFSKEHVAVGYATLHSGSHASVIRIYDSSGQLTATHSQPAARKGGPAL